MVNLVPAGILARPPRNVWGYAVVSPMLGEGAVELERSRGDQALVSASALLTNSFGLALIPIMAEKITSRS